MRRASTLRRALSAPSTRSTEASPFRHRAALLALAPLGLAFLAIVVWAPWHSMFDIDSSTRYLQILSIARHGTAGYANGPVQGNPELTPRWLFPAHGLAWGPYPVLGDAVLAIGAKLGGYRGVTRVIWALFAAACLFTYALTYRLTRRPAVAVAAAYSLALATSSAFWSTSVAPFVPAAAFGIAGLDVLARSFGASSRAHVLALAAASGVLASLAVGSHLVGTAGWAAIPVVCLFAGGAAGRVARPLGYLLGSAPGLAVMAWVNHVRFDVWSPFSYGPCDTDGCLDGATASNNAQNGQAFLTLSLPYVPYVLLFVAGCWLLRRSSGGLVAISIVGALAALMPANPGGILFRGVARTLWATLFDTGSLDFGYPKWGDDPGVFSFWMRIGTRIAGPWCVRSVLQCSPFLVAVFLPLGRGGSLASWGLGVAQDQRRGAYVILVAACAGVLAVTLMRAGLPGPNSIGMPFLNYRYMVTVLPAATVLAFVAVAELPFRVWHVALAVATGILGAALLSRQATDDDHLRRQVTHWLPLGLAFGAWLSLYATTLLARARHRRAASGVATLLVSLSIGYGVAITFGIDRVVTSVVRGHQDARAEQLARCTPRRLILVGAAAMNESLGMLDEKDMLFMDPLMGPRDGSNVQRILLEEMSEDRPAFLIDENSVNPWVFHWPGLAFEAIPRCDGIRRIVRTDARETPAPSSSHDAPRRDDPGAEPPAP